MGWYGYMAEDTRNVTENDDRNDQPSFTDALKPDACWVKGRRKQYGIQQKIRIRTIQSPDHADIASPPFVRSYDQLPLTPHTGGGRP